MNHDGPMNEVGLNVIADVLSMLGLPGGALASLGRVVVAEHGRRISVTLATAEAMTGLSREELAARITSDSEAIPLTVRVLQAAGNSGNDRTLRALGAALARSHQDPAHRHEEELIVVSLEGLTDEHLDVLALCSEEAQTPEQLAARLSGRMDSAVMSMALMNMLPRGLFDTPFGRYGGGQWWALSALGVAVRDAAIAAYPSKIDGQGGEHL